MVRLNPDVNLAGHGRRCARSLELSDWFAPVVIWLVAIPLLDEVSGDDAA